MSAKSPVDTLFERVVDRGLCTRCGTCVGVCPANAIRISDPLGLSLPERSGACTSCGLCLEGCPGERVDFMKLESAYVGEGHSDSLLGIVRSAYLSHAMDPGIRRAGASGGVATALQLFLLRERRIDGSILYAGHDSEPWRGEGRIVETEDGIAAAAQSRYHLSPMNTALKRLFEKSGRYAYVGLPCHVHGLRKLQAAGWKTKAEIGPVIGIYCGNNLYFEATRAVLRKLGFDRLEDIVSLSYREGRWPGDFTATDRNGRTRSISKLDFNQTIPFYANHRCLTCIDLTNELSDISIGDGWAKEEASQEGWSIVLARTEEGERTVRDAAAAGHIHIEGITLGEAAGMHSHAFDLKKKGAFIRIALWKSWGRAVPSYDREPPPQKLSRRIAELFVASQFIVCSSGAGRSVFKRLPLGATGAAFRFLRKIWMRRSK
ncbi:MAG TPA: 4Fe-4S dicluster domain-containing protein [Candidatus Eisenbacteria bacterium]|uniref:4Fe-4S dicluster domain-containing protein n=1 Tax=Eiseniibacteriota bacterium TaxID=2212470 RepID=A0A7V2AVP7_UNCEI|nr:4Fe-4S dicluster domain-containing protein [Candidatus Eisenbacteria bacterium]